MSRASHAAFDQINFDLLRLLFAGLETVLHSFELIALPDPVEARLGTTSLGQLAVDGFFLISGYIITQSWLILGVAIRRRLPLAICRPCMRRAAWDDHRPFGRYAAAAAH